MIYAFLRALMRAMTTTYLLGLFQVIGAANIPRTGALIICPNHSATLDPPMVPAFVPRNDTWNMAKSEYFRTRLLRFIYRSYHSFPVVRHTADRAALRRAFDLLKAGQVLIIYPEGTRVESGVLASPEPGAGFIAQKSGSPVLPVALTGTRDCLPKGAHWPRRTRVTITFGKPFVVLPRRADESRVTHEEASDAIMVAIAELLPPDQRGVFTDLASLSKRLAGVTAPLPLQGEVQGGGGPKSALPSG
jgi:1-acyl-sn-glycerol-3-phosphate acyltransferase